MSTKKGVLEQRIINIVKITLTIVLVVVAIIGAKTVVDVVYHPELDALRDMTTELGTMSSRLDNMTIQLEGMTVQLENMSRNLQNFSKTWHQAYRGEMAGDWLGPFYLKGEQASITWVGVDGVIPEGELAELCHQRENTACFEQYVEVGKSEFFDLFDGASPDEGWFYLHHTTHTSMTKAVEVYLYY